DMSIDELDVLTADKRGVKNVPLMGSNSISIELLPFVNSVLRFGMTSQQSATLATDVTAGDRDLSIREVAKRVAVLKEMIDDLAGERQPVTTKDKRKSRKRL